MDKSLFLRYTLYAILFFFKKIYIGLCVYWKIMKKRQDILGIMSFARALILLFLLVTRSLRHIRAVHVYSLNMVYFLYALYVQYIHRMNIMNITEFVS